MQTTPIIGHKVTIKNFSETYMVKSIVGDGSTVDLLTLTGKPCAVMDVGCAYSRAGIRLEIFRCYTKRSMSN